MKQINMLESPVRQVFFSYLVPSISATLVTSIYILADTMMIGRGVGGSGIAAMNILLPLYNTYFGIGMMCGVGGSVLFGFSRGRGDEKRARSYFTAALCVVLALSAVFLILGRIFFNPLITFMGNTPLLNEYTVPYGTVLTTAAPMFALSSFLQAFVRNDGAPKLAMAGVISGGVTNVILDLLVVALFHMGVGAAALATVLSQALSALLCLVQLLKSPEEYRVSLKKIRLDLPMLKQIIANGLPAGVQNSIIALANVVVQSNINAFGKIAMAGCGSYSKIEGFVFLPVTCFALSITTFTSQNLGAGNYDRVKKGGIFGAVCSIILAELVGVALYILMPVLIAAFNRDPDVIRCGVAQARTIAPFYFLLAFSHCAAGILRGAGKSAVPMFVMMVCWCIIRVTYITITVRMIPSIRVIFWAYPLTWALSSIVFLFYLFKTDWIHPKRKNV